MKKNLTLLTGATGFLGENVARRLEGSLYPTSRSGDTGRGIFAMDLNDAHAVTDTIDSVAPVCVIHLGAVVNLTRDADLATSILETNIVGTLNILEALRSHPPKTFVFASSEEIYGDNQVPFHEEYEPRPPSPYAISKIVCEQLISLYAIQLGFTAIILRLGTMYGPGQASTRFIPSMIINALQNKDIPINSGKKSRDYLYIDDAVDAVLLTSDMFLSDNVIVINVGGGKPHRLNELVLMIKTATGSASEILVGVLPERTSESDMWHMDITKARDVLGWKPRISLDEGIRRTCEFYKKEVTV